MRYKNDKKNVKFVITTTTFVFFELKTHQNPFSAGRGSAPDPTEGAYDAPLDPLIG